MTGPRAQRAENFGPLPDQSIPGSNDWTASAASGKFWPLTRCEENFWAYNIQSARDPIKYFFKLARDEKMRP